MIVKWKQQQNEFQRQSARILSVFFSKNSRAFLLLIWIKILSFHTSFLFLKFSVAKLLNILRHNGIKTVAVNMKSSFVLFICLSFVLSSAYAGNTFSSLIHFWLFYLIQFKDWFSKYYYSGWILFCYIGRVKWHHFQNGFFTTKIAQAKVYGNSVVLCVLQIHGIVTFWANCEREAKNLPSRHLNRRKLLLGSIVSVKPSPFKFRPLSVFRYEN